MDDTKNLILDKAKERAEQYGFKKTTMDEISADCRISKKTIYQHFENKEDMFRSLVIRECKKATQMLFAQIESIADPIEKLTQLIQNAVSYFNQDHFISKVLKEYEMDWSLSDKSYREIIDEEVISLIVNIIRDGKTKGAFRDVDEEITAYAGLKLFQSFTVARTGFLRQYTEPKSTGVLIDFILNGIIKH
jgi:AcrR family transcriptional regulator